jgi:hypothetical protein
VLGGGEGARGIGSSVVAGSASFWRAGNASADISALSCSGTALLSAMAVLEFGAISLLGATASCSAGTLGADVSLVATAASGGSFPALESSVRELGDPGWATGSPGAESEGCLVGADSFVVGLGEGIDELGVGVDGTEGGKGGRSSMRSGDVEG